MLWNTAGHCGRREPRDMPGEGCIARDHDREGCQHAVYCTPRQPEAHARDIRRAVDHCPHLPTGE